MGSSDSTQPGGRIPLGSEAVGGLKSFRRPAVDYQPPMGGRKQGMVASIGLEQKPLQSHRIASNSLQLHPGEPAKLLRPRQIQNVPFHLQAAKPKQLIPSSTSARDLVLEAKKAVQMAKSGMQNQAGKGSLRSNERPLLARAGNVGPSISKCTESMLHRRRELHTAAETNATPACGPRVPDFPGAEPS
jgi:hypothetical protein